MKINSIGFLGGGRIVRIMLAAWQRGGQLPEKVIISDNDPAVRERLKKEFPSIEVVSENSAPAGCQIIFMALHPPAAKAVLPEIKSALTKEAVLISLAPVLTASRLSGLLDGFGRIVRMIPNASSLIGQGYNPVWYGPSIGDEERAALEKLFAPLGQTPEVAEESLEAYAILSAMGPTYFWFQMFQLMELGQSFGLSKEAAAEAVCRMLGGAAATVAEGNLSPDQIMDLIPVKPLAEDEPAIRKIYQERLAALYQKIKPAG